MGIRRGVEGGGMLPLRSLLAIAMVLACWIFCMGHVAGEESVEPAVAGTTGRIWSQMWRVQGPGVFLRKAAEYWSAQVSTLCSVC